MVVIRTSIVVLAFVLQVGSAVFAEALRQEGEPQLFKDEPTRTGKERLGGKWSDEQRVDNCNVPPALRGPKPRADRCVDDAGTSSRR